MNTLSKSTSDSSKYFTTANIALISVMTAVICILAPLSLPIPISPVPISLTNLAVYLTIYVLGTKRGTTSYLIYMLLGLVGLPVFSGFSSGAGKLFGPTGGYIIGFFFMAIICGIFIERFPKNYLLHFVGMVLGTVVCYILGTLWLQYQCHMSFSAALAAGVIPFIPGDLIKIILSLLIGSNLRSRLKKANLI